MSNMLVELAAQEIRKQSPHIISASMTSSGIIILIDKSVRPTPEQIKVGVEALAKALGVVGETTVYGGKK